MSAFDPAAFEASTTSDASSTSITPVPSGEYNSIIEDYKWREITVKKTNEKSVTFDITYALIDDTGQLQALLGRPPKVTQSYFVDLDSQGRFDFSKGKNVWLGRIREALGQNVPGQVWSFTMLKGQPIKTLITEEPSKDDPEVIYNRVKTVGKIA